MSRYRSSLLEPSLWDRILSWSVPAGVLLILFGLGSWTCSRTNEVAAERGRALLAVRSLGWRDSRVQGVETLNWKFFSPCGHGDVVAFDVYGTTAAGEKDRAIVCCGIWKSCTVRTQ